VDKIDLIVSTGSSGGFLNGWNYESLQKQHIPNDTSNALPNLGIMIELKTCNVDRIKKHTHLINQKIRQIGIQPACYIYIWA
jgi:hypothetical protein